MSDARYNVPPPRGSLAHRLLRRHRLALRLGAGTALQALVEPGEARVPSPTYYQGLPLDPVPAGANAALPLSDLAQGQAGEGLAMLSAPPPMPPAALRAPEPATPPSARPARSDNLSEPVAPPSERPGASGEAPRSVALSYAPAADPGAEPASAAPQPERPEVADNLPAGVARLAAPLLASLRALADRLPGAWRQGQAGPAQARHAPVPPAVPQPSDLRQRPEQGRVVQAALVPAPAQDPDAGRSGVQESAQPAAPPDTGPGDELPDGSPAAWAARLFGPPQATPAPAAEASGRRGADAAAAGRAAPPASQEVVTADDGDQALPEGLRPSSEAPAVEERDDGPAAWAARLFGPPPPARAPGAKGREPASVQRRSSSAPLVPEGQPLRDREAPPEPVRGAGQQPAEPLRESTRRFLRPLVGIDPADARIVRGPEGERVAAAHTADAVTAGDTIAFAAGQGDESPAGLGLLAHELTHVARQRDPGFVPPVLQSPAGGHQPVAPRSEEALALQVEQEIRRAARRKMGLEPAEPMPIVAHQPEAATTARPEMPGAPGLVGDAASAPAAAPSMDPSLVPTEPIGQPGRSWGEMPAPWEPMPFWQSGTPPGVAAPSVAAASATLPEHTAPASAAPGTAPATGVQAAARDRSLFDDRQPPPQPAPTPTVAPDLDAMARDVYAILRRRLLAEQRRSGEL